ncbi:MAG: translational GTPase TypA [Gammaproteobacteria bacterium]|nr:translational GTPase TypA [Gammaproteobacteria bacterium]
MKNRNIAIIAHVDHGKTTLVDRLLQETVIGAREKLADRALDSNELERERGITILSKTTAVEYKGIRINIVDTPGHADFGGEVERVLSMVDSVLLLVDAVEGPMPQTRFVTSKAFAAGLNPLVVVNKVDRPGARPEKVVEEVFDLFDSLECNEEQLDFPVVFTSALLGQSGSDHRYLANSMQSVLDLIVDHVPEPPAVDGAFQMQVCTLDYSPYVGVIGIGRVQRGMIRAKMPVQVVSKDGTVRNSKLMSIQANRGLQRVDLATAAAGDIVCVTGIDNLEVSETICDAKKPEALPALTVDEPTVTMAFHVNSSPLAGQEGEFLTSRHLRSRLFTEATHNVALRVAETDAADVFNVSGRGELHLSVLIETMRREGFELAVSQPSVITRVENGVVEEPFETLSLSVETIYQGKVMELLGERRARLIDIATEGQNRVRLTYTVATRALSGFRSLFATETSGTGVMTFGSAGYAPQQRNFNFTRRNGVLISNCAGKAVAYALFSLQERGQLFIAPGDVIYEGMVVGIHNKASDLVVNPTKEKKLTNIRAAGSDENILLTPPIQLTLERSIEFIGADELVEVTPSAIRVRKQFLTENLRKQTLRRPASNT